MARREEAKAALLTSLLFALDPFSYVLSFVSFRSEIETSLLNEKLSQQGRLLLPKMEGEDLSLYLVRDLSKELSLHPFGLLEPKSELCQKIDPGLVFVALVPALAFDEDRFRLGYGKGYYDRFLAHHPNILSWGVGYREQKIDRLPRDKSDHPLTAVYLY